MDSQQLEHRIKHLGTASIALAAAAMISGCASNPGANHTDYDNLPGSGDHMAAGPGVFSKGQKDYDGGYRVFSTDSSKSALIHSNAGKQSKPVATSTAAPAASNGPPAEQKQQFQQFQEYQQFKKFQQIPKNSPEYQNFRDWQNWKEYQQWKNHSRSGSQ